MYFYHVFSCSCIYISVIASFIPDFTNIIQLVGSRCAYIFTNDIIMKSSFYFCVLTNMEGSDTMFNTLFVVLIAPIIVGVIVTLFSHWLNKRNK